MPRRDGTGPVGKGAGGGLGRGKGWGGGAGTGLGGNCVCPKCGSKQPHKRGIPCNTLKCPQCGTTLVRG